MLWWSMPYVWTLYQRTKFISKPHFYKILLQWVMSFTYLMGEFFGFLYCGRSFIMHWKWDWVVKQENPVYSCRRYFSDFLQFYVPDYVMKSNAWNLTVISIFCLKIFEANVRLLSLEIFFTLFIWKHVLLIIWQEA